MTQSDLNAPPGFSSQIASLFSGMHMSGGEYNESFSSANTPREHWQSLIGAMDSMGSTKLHQCRERARRMRHEDGATFNPFDNPEERKSSWALDLIPLPITSADWSLLASGLQQRAALLEKILEDTYGEQHLVKSGAIPAELIFANPQFLRPCHGIRPAGNRFLTFYAADLYRNSSGGFTILRDYAANPSGIGYALENRIVISRIFPELYHTTQIRRLAPFFQTLHRSLLQRASLRKEDPGIVLLSPGPDSPLYFEHAFLSRYLGYPLVEGQDLTVRNGRVFLKKLAGLEPVEAIIRHISDDHSDPFALRRETASGVAGLIHVGREQNIDIVNPIGSGFLETPALSVFLPLLCRHLLGEELLLPGHPAWWCGNAEGHSHVFANIDELAINHAMGKATPTPDHPENLRAAIDAAPYAFMAHAPLRPSVVPNWGRNGISQHYGIIRVFTCATESGFTVMPGGLAITAPDIVTLTGNNPEQQQSKDIWVLSDQPVEPFSLMASLNQVTEFKRSSDLPSRAADHLLWLGRYLERAEGRIRLMRSVFQRLAGEARPQDIPELNFLLTLLRADGHIPQTEDERNPIPPFRTLFAQLSEALYREEGPKSVFVVLRQIQVAARNVRDRLSLDSWRVLHRLEDVFQYPSYDPLELLDEMLFTLSSFSGLAMEGMTRGLGWRFMDMGRRLERAMNLTHLINLGLPHICSSAGNSLEALLEVCESIMTYRGRYRSAFRLAPVLDLLLADETNPKSLAFQCLQLSEHVALLPRQNDRRFSCEEERIALQMLTTIRLLDLTGLRCSEGAGVNPSLTSFFAFMEEALKEFAQQVSGHYLSRVPATPHYSMISGESQP